MKPITSDFTKSYLYVYVQFLSTVSYLKDHVLCNMSHLDSSYCGPGPLEYSRFP